MRSAPTRSSWTLDDCAVSGRMERLIVDAVLRVLLLRDRLDARLLRTLPSHRSGCPSPCGSPPSRCTRRASSGSTGTGPQLHTAVQATAVLHGRRSGLRLVRAIRPADLGSASRASSVRSSRSSHSRVRSGQLAAPFLAYGLLWLSTVVRQPSIIAKHDVSYGFYIYAWPVAQLLVLVGAARAGVWVFMLANIAVTLVFAALSWFLVERPIMRATRGSTRSCRRSPLAPDAADSQAHEV